MIEKQIRLPEGDAAWLDAQVASGQYADADEAVRNLIRQARDEEQALRDALKKGLDSGISSASPKYVRQRVRSRLSLDD